MKQDWESNAGVDTRSLIRALEELRQSVMITSLSDSALHVAIAALSHGKYRKLQPPIFERHLNFLHP